MKNRIPKAGPDKLSTFFLACEFKPKTPLFSVLDPFAYDISPAYIHGSLGVVSYSPQSYAVIDVDDENGPLMGYILTVTHPETALLLDKLKGAYGQDAYNTHVRRTVKAFTDVSVAVDAWCYVLSEYVLEAYERIEQVEFGLWDENDEAQVALLEKIGDSL